MRVLVTGAGALLGQGIIRSLRGSTLDVQVVGADPSPLAVGLRWCDEAHTVPLAGAPEYGAAIDDLLAQARPDAVLVGTDVELPFFARHRERLEREHELRVLVSSCEVVDVANDKYRTWQFLDQHGFDPPRSCLPDSADALAAHVGFPLIVKPRVGARAVGVVAVHNSAELRSAIAGADEPVVVQELVGADDVEYTAGALCFDGRCVASIVMRRELRDGNTWVAYVEDFPELRKQVAEVASALGPYGPANFQFRLEGGRLRIFEINARFSGTTPFRMLAGLNEVEASLRYVLLGEPIHQPPVEPMVIARYLDEVVVTRDLPARTKGT